VEQTPLDHAIQELLSDTAAAKSWMDNDRFTFAFASFARNRNGLKDSEAGQCLWSTARERDPASARTGFRSLVVRADDLAKMALTPPGSFRNKTGECVDLSQIGFAHGADFKTDLRHGATGFSGSG